AMRQLEFYDWPGNVRELENTMERAVALESGSEISLPVLPDRIAGYSGIGAAAVVGGRLNIPAEGIDFEKEMADAERRYLQAALEKADGVRTRAAETLKITYRSFRHYAKKHNI
ncbi:MAG TPA: helix-turn-helix domain-containing protein, partial [Chthoniobacterales bacterium]|nr:helix-turn-helix domain-containing protein [Chthoniobacterales bacterium]